MDFTNFISQRIAGIATAAACALALAGPASATPFPGPDGFGYSAETIAFNARNIQASGTFVSLGDDEVSAGINMGFAFSFYGNAYSTAYISSNGYITFNNDGNSGCCDGEPLPGSANGSNLIAGFWTDLNGLFDQTDVNNVIHVPDQIRYETRGVAGSREFVVGFYNNHFYFTDLVNGIPDAVGVSFEMILKEGSNEIELQYIDATSQNRNVISTGITNDGSTIGLQIGLGRDISYVDTGYRIFLTPTAVPEPGVLALVSLGLLGLGFSRRRTT